MSETTVTRADLSEAVYQEVGLSRNDSAALVETIVGLPRLRVDGVYTHMAVPPDPAGASYVDQEFFESLPVNVGDHHT